MPTTFNTKRFKKSEGYKSPSEKKKEEQEKAPKVVVPKGEVIQSDVRNLGTSDYYKKGYSTKPNYTAGEKAFYGARNIFRSTQKATAGWKDRFDEVADSVSNKVKNIGKNIGKEDERAKIGGMPSVDALEQWGKEHPELTANKEENDKKISSAIEYGQKQYAQKQAKEAAARYQEQGRKRTAAEKGIPERKLDAIKALAPSAEEQRKEQKKVRDALVPATPFKSSKPAPGEHSEPEDDDEEEVLSDAEAGESPRDKRQAEKKALEQARDSKQNEYNQLASIIYGAGKRIGVDYTAEDNDKLVALESEIRDINSKLKEYETPIDWEGRKDLIKEYNALYSRQRSNIPLSPEEQARMQEVLKLLQEGDYAVGNDEQTYGLTEGMETFFGGTGGGIASNIINAGVTAVEALAQGQARAYTTDQYLVDIMSGNDPYERMARNEQAAQGIHDVLAPVYDYSDKLGDDAAKAIEKVKGGLGKYGDVAVDLGQNVLQMGFDAGTAALTGGSALGPMFLRVFGESAGEARKAGLSLGRQVGYGVAKGAIEVLTEKIFGGDIGKCYGAGFTDDAVAHAIERLGLSESGSVLLYALNGMNEEGLEEVISDLLSPFADTIKADGSFQEWLDNGYNVEDMLYSYFIGAAIGGLGSVSQVVSGQTRATLDAAAMDNFVEDTKAKQASPFNPNATETTDAGGKSAAVNPADALAGASKPNQNKANTSTATPDTGGGYDTKAEGSKKLREKADELRKKIDDLEREIDVIEHSDSGDGATNADERVEELYDQIDEAEQELGDVERRADEAEREESAAEEDAYYESLNTPEKVQAEISKVEKAIAEAERMAERYDQWDTGTADYYRSEVNDLKNRLAKLQGRNREVTDSGTGTPQTAEQQANPVEALAPSKSESYPYSFSGKAKDVADNGTGKATAAEILAEEAGRNKTEANFPNKGHAGVAVEVADNGNNETRSTEEESEEETTTEETTNEEESEEETATEETTGAERAKPQTNRQKFNTTPEQQAVEEAVDNAKAKLDKAKPGTREYYAAQNDVARSAYDGLEKAFEDINGFLSDPDYDPHYFRSIEPAMEAYKKFIETIRGLKLPSNSEIARRAERMAAAVEAAQKATVENNYSAGQTRSDTDRIIMDEAARLLPEFNEDPVNIQRFADGHGSYGQYNINARLRILNLLYPDADYYISGGSIVKGRSYRTSTGQSTAFGDQRTGSSHRTPRARPAPKSNIKAPSAQQDTFDASSVKEGDTLKHKVWGDVTVQSVSNGTATIVLPDTGEVKTVRLDGKFFSAPKSGAEPATVSMGINTPDASEKADTEALSELNSALESEWRKDNEGQRDNPQPGPTAVDANPGTGEGDQGQSGQPKPGGTSKRVARQFPNRFPARTADEQAKLQKEVEKNRASFRKEIADELPKRSLEKLRDKQPIGDVIDIADLPDGEQKTTWEREIAHFKATHAACEIITCTNGNFGPAYATRYMISEPGAYCIVVDIDACDDFLKKDRAKGRSDSISQVLEHEWFHTVLGQSGYDAVDAHEWFLDRITDPELINLLTKARDMHAELFHQSPYAGKVKENVRGRRENVNLNDRVMREKDLMWNEVFADLLAGSDRCFRVNDVTSNRFGELVLLARQYYDTVAYPAFCYNEGIDSGTPGVAVSGTAQNGGTTTETGEPDPYKDFSRTPEETVKLFHPLTHAQLTDYSKHLNKWAEEWSKHYPSNDTRNGWALRFATKFEQMLKGEISVKAFSDEYESLAHQEEQDGPSDSEYFYDKSVSTILKKFAEAERDYLVRSDPSMAGTVEGDVGKQLALKDMHLYGHLFSNMFRTIENRLQDNFDGKDDSRVNLNLELRKNAKKEGVGRKADIEKLVAAYKRMQMRADTYFMALGGFDQKNSPGLYKLANRVIKGATDYRNADTGARTFFYEATADKEMQKQWRDLESGKIKGGVTIPGVGEVSLNYELAILKTMETKGAIEHMADNDTIFVNEADYYPGFNNSGRGETEAYKLKLTRGYLDKVGMNRLLEKGIAKPSWEEVREEKIKYLRELADEMKQDVLSTEIGKRAYESSTKAMEFLAKHLNRVTRRMYGVPKALQGETYWPLHVIGKNNQAKIINNMAFDMEAVSFLQHRQGPTASLSIIPFSEAMDDYIKAASNVIGYGELSSDLNMMTKDIKVGYVDPRNFEAVNPDLKMSFMSTLKKVNGTSTAGYLTNWMEMLNGKVPQKDAAGRILNKVRKHLATSSLLINAGVALKQGPSYWDAMGLIDPDILFKNRILKGGNLRSAKSYTNDALIKGINKKTNILTSRAAGVNIIEWGESMEEGRSLTGKLRGKIPNWLTNWITKTDYRTVANLAKACGDQVMRNHKDDADFERGSEKFYRETAKLLEEVVVKTQPMYDPQIRAEYLRSNNEVVRSLAMFRTQQTQNLNNLMQARGEYLAAKKSGDEKAAATAKSKMTRVVAGQVAATIGFSILQTAAKLLRHKRKDFEDEEGNLDMGKIAKRVGLDAIYAAAGTAWLGDYIAKGAVDTITGGLSNIKDKDGNPIVERTKDFYGLEDNALTTVSDAIANVVQAFTSPSLKSGKKAAMSLAQACGIPAQNAYNIINAVALTGIDILEKIGKVDPLEHYDDVIEMLQSNMNMTDTQRVKKTTEKAMKYMAAGDVTRAHTLMSSLDYSSKDVRSTVKTAANKAYLNGEIDEMTYKGILRNYAKVDVKDIAGMVADKDLDKKVAEITATDPKKYNALVDAIDNAKDRVKADESKANAVATAILDAAMSQSDTDTFMQKYTTSDYYKAYSALRDVYRPKMAVDLLLDIDSNKNDSYSQEELYNYYLENPGSENMVQKIWDANGYSQNWKQFKDSKAKRAEYDLLANENKDNYQFGAAEKQLKQLKDDAGMYLQKSEADPKMLSTISDMKLSDKDTDTVVDRYVSSKTRTNYHVLRDAGYSAQKAIKALTKFDKDESGTISQKELWKRYKNHPEDEALIESLWNAQGYKGKNTSSWKTYKKYQKKHGK